jgi:hypothetical protein
MQPNCLVKKNVTKLKSESKCGEKNFKFFSPKIWKKFQGQKQYFDRRTENIFPIYFDFSPFGEISHLKETLDPTYFMKIHGNIWRIPTYLAMPIFLWQEYSGNETISSPKAWVEG